MAETLQELWISYNILSSLKGVEKLPKLRVRAPCSERRASKTWALTLAEHAPHIHTELLAITASGQNRNQHHQLTDDFDVRTRNRSGSLFLGQFTETSH